MIKKRNRIKNNGFFQWIFRRPEFRSIRNWSLISSLKFKSETLTREQRDLLVECGIQVTKTTSTITVPKGYITDLVYQFLESVGHS